MIKIIKVADKFPYPGPRFRRLGPQSGEEFKNYLHKVLTDFYGSGFNNNISTRILIDLDGTRGYGSSFLEEGFGGLIRMGIPDSIIKLITIKTDEEPELEDEINSYIDDARNSRA